MHICAPFEPALGAATPLATALAVLPEDAPESYVFAEDDGSWVFLHGNVQSIGYRLQQGHLDSWTLK